MFSLGHNWFVSVGFTVFNAVNKLRDFFMLLFLVHIMFGFKVETMNVNVLKFIPIYIQYKKL